MDIDKERQIIDMITNGTTERQAAAKLGIACSTVHRVIARNGLAGINKDNKGNNKRSNLEEVNKLLNLRGYECVEYHGRHSRVKVRCLKCGTSFERDGSWMYVSAHCPGCSEIQRKERESARQKEREALELLRQREREAKKAETERLKEEKKKAKMNKIHICVCCGESYSIGETGYNSEKYCSKKCQTRLYRRKHEQVRDYRKRWRKHDSDITLEKLFKRDAGKCYICGGKCDWTDMEINDNGDFIAGNQYPSIDHVFPLSKGGTDTWNNIKLAHRICNSIKRDKEEYNGQAEEEALSEDRQGFHQEG